MADRDFVGYAYSIANTASVDHLVDEYFARRPKAVRPGTPGLSAKAEEKAKRSAERQADEFSYVIELARMLVRLGRGQVQMFIEYELYTPDKALHIGPVDVLLTGVDPETGEPAYLLIELKRWSLVAPDPDAPDDPSRVKHYYATDHPAVQVTGHMANLCCHLSVFEDGFRRISAAAYLPNLIAPEYQWIRKAPPSTDATVFTGGDVKAFERFLKEKLAATDGAAAAKLLQESPVLGKRRLEHEFGDVVRGGKSFRLVGSQTLAYEEIVARLAHPDPDHTYVYLVDGGAGTGKTVLAAMIAQAAAADKKRKWRFTSGSRSSLNALRSSAAKHRYGVKFVPLIQLAKHFAPNELELVICDEAQALPDHPVFGSYRVKWKAETSMEVLLSRARVVVLLSDARQRVRPDEVWSPDTIALSVPKDDSIRFQRFSLDLQLRAVNGHSYQTWVRRLLDGERPTPLAYDDAQLFKVYAARTPAQMEAFLRARMAQGHSARMTSGFTYDWLTQTPGEPLTRDIQIGDWSYPWNAPDWIAAGPIPPAERWAFADGGFEQMGSIFAARGHEYDWGGVIIGKDLL
jgi:hypothetical protein